MARHIDYLTREEIIEQIESVLLQWENGEVKADIAMLYFSSMFSQPKNDSITSTKKTNKILERLGLQRI